MKKRITLFCAFLLIGISLAIAQAVQVTGVVMSAEDDMPVVGASILVKGTSNGTITDIDGKFILKVNKGDKLEISYIGMKSQTVAAKNNMKVVLESDTEVLDEVVVTGMQRMDKRLFTGASTKISAEDSKLDGVPENQPCPGRTCSRCIGSERIRYFRYSSENPCTWCHIYLR